MIDQDREGAEPARIDKRGALGRPSAPFEGKPVGGRAAKVRVQRDFALCETLGQLNAVLAGASPLPTHCSELPVEPCVAPARRRRVAARPEGCPHRCPTNSEGGN